MGRYRIFNAPAPLPASPPYGITPGTTTGPQNIELVVPTSLRLGGRAPLLLYCHGRTDNEQVVITNASYEPTTKALINAGWMVASSNAHGDAFGSTLSLDDYVNLYTFVAARYTVTDVVLFGRSMGGLPSLLLVPDGRISSIRGWIGNAPLCNLAWSYAQAAFTANIDTAYGITGVSPNTYAEKTAGHDPVLLPAGSWAGLRLRFYSSTLDTTATKVDNADVLSALATGTLENAFASGVTGGHSDASHFQPADVVAFCERCRA